VRVSAARPTTKEGGLPEYQVSAAIQVRVRQRDGIRRTTRAGPARQSLGQRGMRRFVTEPMATVAEGPNAGLMREIGLLRARSRVLYLRSMVRPDPDKLVPLAVVAATALLASVLVVHILH
jgi:hypothetical protein